MRTKQNEAMSRRLRAGLTTVGALAAAVALCDCGPTFRLRPAPALPPMLPPAPSIPSSEATETEQAPTDGVHRATAHAMSDLRAQTMAVAVEGDEGVTTDLVRMLPRVFVAARFTRVLLPDTVQNLSGTLERTVGGDRTSLTGTLLRLLPMRAATPADQLVRVRVTEGTAAGQHARHFAIPADQLQSYAAAFATYQERVEALRRSLARGDANAFAAEYQQARAEYESRGGRYDDRDERGLRDDAEAYLSAHQRAGEQLQTAARVPTPEQVREQGTREERQATVRPAVTLEVVLTDLRAGETWWVGEVVGMGDSREAALARAVQLLIGELGSGGASTGGVAP